MGYSAASRFLLPMEQHFIQQHSTTFIIFAMKALNSASALPVLHLEQPHMGQHRLPMYFVPHQFSKGVSDAYFK